MEALPLLPWRMQRPCCYGTTCYQLASMLVLHLKHKLQLMY